METITVEKFKEIVEKDEALKAKADAILSVGDETSDEFDEFAESLGYVLDRGGDVVEIEDDDLEEVSGGARCNHDFKFTNQEITKDGFKRRYYYCRKCGIHIKQVTRIKEK